MPFSLRCVLRYALRFLCLLGLGLAVPAIASEPSPAKVSAYVHSDNPMLDVQAALEKAKIDDKLLLVVMGAQWCHDSRGLVDKFADSRLQKILADSYELVFVDVAYYNDLREITQRFGQPHYFATPTVMIVNADTERLLNAKDMHIWGSADSVPIETYLDYFATYAANPVPQFLPLPPALASVVNAFEQQNAQRLNDAYQVLVPGMQAEDRTGKASKAFLDQWREVRRYRTTLQQDIQKLRQQAQLTPDQELVIPQYPAFSWEDAP